MTSRPPHDHDGAVVVTPDEPPFGLPVLAEVPELAATLDTVRQLDRLQARLIDQLTLLTATGLAETTTGVALDQWLATVGQVTRTDRRMLATTVRVLGRLPSVAAAFAVGQVSWSQLRTLVLKVGDLPRHLDDRLDHELARAVAEVASGPSPTDPDALARVVTWVLADVHPDDPQRDEQAEPDDVLVLQPRLDGAGGRYWGEAGPVGFALLDAATDPGPSGLPASRPGFGRPPDEEAARPGRQRVAHARALRLYDRLHHPGPRADDGAAHPGPVRLLARAELSTLLDRDRFPAQLLTTLAGGRMRLTSDAARRLVDAHGADLRLVITDHGQVVGVGRRRRHPPGWLRDATLALHDTCAEPGCVAAARTCDLDHATPWAPPGDGRPGGRTDVDQLAPLCRPANRTKETDGWTATQTADGVRTWSHARSGVAVRTLPATWRPPPDGPDPPSGSGTPDGPDLPSRPIPPRRHTP